MIRLPSLALTLVSLVPSTGAAQLDSWERDVQRHLAQATRRLHDAGYESTPDTLAGTLNTGESTWMTLRLEAGRSFVVTGVCDADCAALELALYSPNGYEVDAARSAESAPIVQVVPRETGRYRVRVVMARCTTNPCRYGIGVFRKREAKGS